jgi:hypothetical protein
MAITLRQESSAGATTKGSSLTYAELDNNFVDLLTNKMDDLGDDTTPQLGGSLDVNGQGIISVSNGNITITPDGSGKVILDGISWPTADGTNAQVLQTDGAGNLSFTTVASGGISNVVEDTTPQLGGHLDSQGNKIQNPVLEDYAETVEAIGSNDSPGLTVANGNVKTVTIASGLALSAFTDAAAGQTITLIVSGSGSATGTGTYKFAGGNKTLTNDSIVSIHTPDGTNYFASIATDFQA